MPRPYLVRLAAGLLVWLLAPSPALAALPPADAEVLRRIEAYLDGIGTLEARFEQIGPDGGLATGKVYIQRPGRMRIDYDPPSQILLVATDWRLIFWDGSIEQQNVIPVNETPLAFLLGDRLSLGGGLEVTRIGRRQGEIDITVIRGDAPDQGSVTLTFGEAPLELRRWSVTDAQGLTTTVLLQAIETGKPLDPGLFRWRDPKMFGPPR
jgi:outer membrane lipoprotein-sorting protein